MNHVLPKVRHVFVPGFAADHRAHGVQQSAGKLARGLPLKGNPPAFARNAPAVRQGTVHRRLGVQGRFPGIPVLGRPAGFHLFPEHGKVFPRVSGQRTHRQPSGRVQRHALSGRQHVHIPDFIQFAKGGGQRNRKLVVVAVAQLQRGGGKVHRADAPADFHRRVPVHFQFPCDAKRPVPVHFRQRPPNQFLRRFLQVGLLQVNAAGSENGRILFRNIQQVIPRFPDRPVPVRRLPPDGSRRKRRHGRRLLPGFPAASAEKSRRKA